MIIQDILREVGITGKELSLRLGINYNWYRRATMRSKKEKPNWVKSFELGYEMGAEKKSNAGASRGMEENARGAFPHSDAVGRNFILYYGKKDKCAVVEFDGHLFKAEFMECHVPVVGEYPKDNGVSWALAGKAQYIYADQNRIIIK